MSLKYHYYSGMSSSDSEDEDSVIILLTGSQNIMAGFAGDDMPRTVFPNCASRERSDLGPKMIACERSAFTIGDAAQKFGAISTLNYPMKQGIIQDWDAQESIWFHAIHNELRKEPSKYGFCISKHLAEPRDQTEKTIQVMFETFNVPRLYMVDTTMSAMYASGCTCGVVVDCGHGRVHIAPFYEGIELRHAATSLPYGGDDITEYLQRMLNSRAGGVRFTSSSDREVVRAIKEKLSYVALDYQTQLETSESVVYDLPDWQQVWVGTERFEAPELLFKPHLIGSHVPGIHEAVHATIMRCELVLRADLWSNILVVGGVSLTPGFSERLKRELLGLAPTRLQENAGKLKVRAPPERQYDSWIGMSIVGSLTNYKGAWMTNEQYSEGGPAVGAMLFR